MFPIDLFIYTFEDRSSTMDIDINEENRKEKKHKLIFQFSVFYPLEVCFTVPFLIEQCSEVKVHCNVLKKMSRQNEMKTQTGMTVY